MTTILKYLKLNYNMNYNMNKWGLKLTSMMKRKSSPLASRVPAVWIRLVHTRD